SSAALSRKLTVSSVSPKYCRRSECPTITCVTPKATSMGAETSPVNAPSSFQCTFCAPMATFESLDQTRQGATSTKGGQTTIWSGVWPATIGRKSTKKARAWSGVLHIFQLAAMSLVLIGQGSRFVGKYWQPELFLLHS